MLFSAGFEVTEKSPFYINRFNVHPKTRRTPRTLPSLLARQALTKDSREGILHRALLARPRL
jgi:hypothetical protein